MQVFKENIYKVQRLVRRMFSHFVMKETLLFNCVVKFRIFSNFVMK